MDKFAATNPLHIIANKRLPDRAIGGVPPPKITQNAPNRLPRPSRLLHRRPRRNPHPRLRAGVETILAIGIGEGPDHHAPGPRDRQPSHRHPNIYATAGIHPQEAAHATPEALAKLDHPSRRPKMHRHRRDRPRLLPPRKPRHPHVQKAAFIAQMQIAAAARKPIIIHCRTSELATPQAKAKFESTETRRRLGRPPRPHRRTLDPARPARRHHALLLRHGRTGPALPRRRLLPLLRRQPHLPHAQSPSAKPPSRPPPTASSSKPTAPFLAPIPLRGQRNEPALVTHTAAALADLRGISPEELAAVTTENFHRLFPTTSLT